MLRTNERCVVSAGTNDSRPRLAPYRLYKILPTRGTSLFVASIVVLIELNALDPLLSPASTEQLAIPAPVSPLQIPRLAIEISYERWFPYAKFIRCVMIPSLSRAMLIENRRTRKSRHDLNTIDSRPFLPATLAGQLTRRLWRKSSCAVAFVIVNGTSMIFANTCDHSKTAVRNLSLWYAKIILIMTGSIKRKGNISKIKTQRQSYRILIWIVWLFRELFREPKKIKKKNTCLMGEGLWEKGVLIKWKT